jgi:N-acetylmuramoyl-L-alanine amidase
MTVFFLYLAKVSLLAGLLYAYYQLFLRDKPFHQYNRFFLLCIPVAALLLPFVHIPWNYAVGSETSPALLYTVHPGNWVEPAVLSATPHAAAFNWSKVAAGAYALIVCCQLAGFFRQMVYIKRLPRRYSAERFDNICFYNTSEPGTPFSFLHHLFWNDQLDTHSPRGQQILRHELYHIRQKHTVDVLFLKPLLIFFWPVPLFHLLYREIRAIHEFMADGYAISGGDKYEYAELLIWQTIRNPAPSLLHPFFNSPIKRRINMLTQIRTNRTGLLSRIMILPVLFFLLCAFAIRLRPHPAAQHAVINGRPAGELTVIIDAGHGGPDAGSMGVNCIPEKDINLALALKMKQLSPEYHVNVVLTREKDELSGGSSDVRASLEYRAGLAATNKADLFISLHVNSTATGNDETGITIYVSRDHPRYTQCTELGSDMLSVLKGTYTTAQALKDVHQHVYVLRQTTMPAILIACGNIRNARDMAFITNEQNQEKVARDVLEGIQRYQAEHIGRRPSTLADMY